VVWHLFVDLNVKQWGMMERDSSMLVGWRGVVLAILVIAVVSFEPAYCEPSEIALMLQQTPAGGGEITPARGVHRFDLNIDVTLTAVPKPGYRFVYWLGDVSDPTVSTTTVYVDAPKIIIAVFERAEYEFPEEIERATGSYGEGSIAGPAADYSRGGGGGAIKWRSSGRHGRKPPEEPEEELPDFLVPNQNADFFVPPAIPEPATVVLLGLGSLLAFARGTGRVKRRAL
jgi:hypothetical protein